MMTVAGANTVLRLGILILTESERQFAPWFHADLGTIIPYLHHSRHASTIKTIASVSSSQ